MKLQRKIVLCFCIIFCCMVSVTLARSVAGNSLGNMTIMGQAVATKQQCLEHLLRVNPRPSLSVPPRKLIDQYYEEAEREGVRPDIAFAQALKETGYFRYGGLVKPQQNNYCGLGSMSRLAKGAWFPNSQIGVRAHIQHILAYSTTRSPYARIVDPRYDVVKTTRNFGQARFWRDLNGRWAVPGANYGEGILDIYRSILAS